LGGLRTLSVATQCGLKTFLERPNSHTEYAFEVVKNECDKLHYRLPKKHSHCFRADKLLREKKEYEVADKLLCPSQFVYDSFIKKGFPESKLSLYHYGCDFEKFSPCPEEKAKARPFRVVFVASCEPRKGLHYALKAWLMSKARQTGEFVICGEYVDGYRDILKDDLRHTSIKEVGYVDDLRSMFSGCDVMILPTVEEGSALVNYIARACGCVILVSDAAGAWGTHGYDLMVHRPGDVETLAGQIDLFCQDNEFLKKIRSNSLREIQSYTWDHAIELLIKNYTEALK